jgi:hypothetical protein
MPSLRCMNSPRRDRLDYCSSIPNKWILLLRKVLVATMLLQLDTSCVECTTATSAGTKGKFLIFSDIHYDAFYGTSDAFTLSKWSNKNPCSQRDAPYFSTYGCESNFNLIQSLLANAAQAYPNPDFIICTGDWTRHGADRTTTNTNSVQSTVDQAFHVVLSQLLPLYFPNVTLLALPPLDLGNNDYESDYRLDITSLQPCLVQNYSTTTAADAAGSSSSYADNAITSILPNATNSWLSSIAQTFQSTFVSQEEEAVFACGGYLSREVIPGLHIIVLNTLLWSDALISNHYDKNTLSQDGFDPFGQHQWLKYELTRLRQLGKRTYITGHIPPIAISYYPYEGNPLLFESHTRRYHTSISEFSDVIAGQFFGHTHSNELRVSNSLPSDSPPIIIIGAVSPIYGNDPGFSIVTYHQSGESEATNDTTQSYQRVQQPFVPLDLVTFHLNLKNITIIYDNYNNTIAKFQPLFPSLIQFLNISNLTNGQIWDLSGRFTSTINGGSTEWMRYWQQWYQDDKHEPACNGNCRIKEACIIACGNLQATWKQCISHPNNPICSLPQTAYSSYSYYLTTFFFQRLGLTLLVLLSIGGILLIFTCRYHKCGRNGFIRAPDIESILATDYQEPNNDSINCNNVMLRDASNLRDIPTLT